MQTTTQFLQAAVFPFRIVDGALQICLVTSRTKGKWGFPKGNIDFGESATTTAKKEAMEEAGLQGALSPKPIGMFEYRKQGTWRNVAVYSMEVQEAQESWPEAGVRKRGWFTVEQARRCLCRSYLRIALEEILTELQQLGVVDGSSLTSPASSGPKPTKSETQKPSLN